MNILKWKGLEVDPYVIKESITTKAEVGRIDTQFNESTQESGITVLYPKIEAIHEGRTRNCNRYPAEKLKGNHELKSGVYSWTQPYPKPVIFNHDHETECTGRVYSASFSEITTAGRPGIFVTPKITQEKAIKDILDGRLLTVSIGATTNAAICSICSTDIINEGYCGHMRGEEYDGNLCEWICGDLYFDELSWVNVPSDSDAMVIATNTNCNTLANQESIEVKSVEESTTLTEEEEVVTKIEETTEKEESTVDINTTIVEETATEETVVVEEKEETVEEATEVEVQAEVQEEATEEANTEVQEEAEAETVEETATEEKPEVVEEELEQDSEALAEAKAEIAELKAANVELAKELQETVVGFLVDLRMAIGKESSREEAMNKFAARSIESLRDSITDILAEKPAINMTRTTEKVERPAGKPITENKTLATQETKVISNEDVYYNLLTGRR